LVKELTQSNLRRIFKVQGLTPKKWLGQNLLTDSRYLREIVQAAGVSTGEPVVEIGSGLGGLTEELVRQGATVWALEIDSGFFRVLEDKFAGVKQVELVHADALKYDFTSLAEKLGRLRVVANLPYNISSRLIFRFYENRDFFRSLHILLQKEVAQRFIAAPGTKEYGVLTVLLGVSAVVDLLFDIPAKAFFPVPEVISTFVHISFPDKPLISMSDPALFTALVKASFSKRRKTMRNALRNASIPGISYSLLELAAEKARIELGRRAETFTPADFARFGEEVSLLSQSVF
jgi:16S rRNA (adenine1518-N6/adenine1519-N6)-dimethyltransferase